jgi:hypothetical protein
MSEGERERETEKERERRWVGVGQRIEGESERGSKRRKGKEGRAKGEKKQVRWRVRQVNTPRQKRLALPPLTGKPRASSLRL